QNPLPSPVARSAANAPVAHSCGCSLASVVGGFAASDVRRSASETSRPHIWAARRLTARICSTLETPPSRLVGFGDLPRAAGPLRRPAPLSHPTFANRRVAGWDGTA